MFESWGSTLLLYGGGLGLGLLGIVSFVRAIQDRLRQGKLTEMQQQEAQQTIIGATAAGAATATASHLQKEKTVLEGQLASNEDALQKNSDQKPPAINNWEDVKKGLDDVGS